MRSKFFCLIIFFSIFCVSAQSIKRIYDLPSDSSRIEVENESYFLAGAQSGLYKILSNNTAIPLFTEASVKKILKVKNPQGKIRYFFETSAGILTSEDLKSFEYRNTGLPFLTIKKFDGKTTSFEKVPAPLKDLAIDPENPNILVTATKDCVFISFDGALNWKNISSMSKSTVGMKAVAVATIEGETIVFMSHPIFGFSYTFANREKIVWHDVNSGFETLPTQTYPDEISDILAVSKKDESGNSKIEIYVAQTFIPRLYRFDWKKKKAEKIFSGMEPADTIESLAWKNGKIVYTTPGNLISFDLESKSEATLPSECIEWKNAFSALAPKDTLYAAHIRGFDGEEISLCELWLLNASFNCNNYIEKIDKIRAVYIPPNKVSTQKGIDSYLNLIKENDLNAIVIDMKDDYGLLRYDSKDPLVLEKGFKSRYSIDLDNFISQFKEKGVYLIARIVSFKDKHLSEYDGGKYAVWDSRLNRAWVGTRGTEEIKDAETGEVTGKKTIYYDENWCDPYSEEVWQYNVAIAKELVFRGFDEIQYDYIRFPTDGLNISNTRYRWKSEGMDKESALISFLKYARENIDAPIGIDIYGANGWYRSGTRTGQDVELLAQYVDVICPMFYPSHFEQSFLNYEPWSERPYRIYFYGSYRNTIIGRNRIIVRPWIQAFYMGVSYDKKYYDKNYVLREIYGVRDSVDSGYMCWNNSGRYDDLSKDPGKSDYPWNAKEASKDFRKPALKGGENFQNGIKTFLAPNTEENSEDSFEDFKEKNLSALPKNPSKKIRIQTTQKELPKENRGAINAILNLWKKVLGE